MIKISKALYLGKCCDCTNALTGHFNIILACHYPCFEKLSKNDCLNIQKMIQRPQEITSEAPAILYLDLCNQEIPRYNIDVFINALKILSQWLTHQDVVIISEHAQSRAASLALLWMAFQEKSISCSSYGAARSDFSRFYPNYAPWPGLVIFLNQEWETFKEIFSFSNFT